LALSATPVAVTDVNVSSTGWDSTFVQYLEAQNLGTDGYRIPVGSGAQFNPLPWNNLNQVRITFSEYVEIDSTDLTVTGANVTQYQFSAFSYDSGTKTATWTLTQTLAVDRVMLDLAGDGLDPVRGVSSDALDGEWTNGSSSYASGNGSAGGDFEFQFSILPGDANQSTLVTTVDYLATYYKNGLHTQSTGYNAFHDVNGSGTINSTDYSFILGKLGVGVSTGTPAGFGNDAPTTAGLASVDVSEDASNEVISLWSAFQDAEDADNALTFAIVSNSNAQLFSSTAVNNGTGELTLDFAANAYGQSELIIRATDSSGLFVESMLQVTVSGVNDAPFITLWGEPGPGDVWTFTGTVTDPDDNPAGRSVILSGVLEDYGPLTISANGTFELLVELPSWTFGNAFAYTVDAQGATSNFASFLVT
jgi:hypothetical protein